MINDDVGTRMGDKENIIKEQIKNTHIFLQPLFHLISIPNDYSCGIKFQFHSKYVSHVHRINWHYITFFVCYKGKLARYQFLPCKIIKSRVHFVLYSQELKYIHRPDEKDCLKLSSLTNLYQLAKASQKWLLQTSLQTKIAPTSFLVHFAPVPKPIPKNLELPSSLTIILHTPIFFF